MNTRKPVMLSKELIDVLRRSGVNSLHEPNSVLFPYNSVFEPPCSLKWLRAEHEFSIGSFSYAVSGYFFACKIGRYCSIGEEVQIGRHSHPLDFGSTSPVFYLDSVEVLGLSGQQAKCTQPLSLSRPPTVLRKTYIGNDVYIGHGSFIIPGTTIGDGAVVGARSVVTRDVPPYAIVAGSPARVLRYRFEESVINDLLNSRWWLFSPESLSIVDPENPLSFIECANKLHERNAELFCPDKVRIGLLSDHLRNEEA